MTTATVAGNARELVLEGLKPETVYEWHVQAVQNGVESLPSFANLFVTASEHPALKLESVAVDPTDQAVAPNASAKVTAATNLDEWVDTSTSITYEWQKRALDSNPDDPDVWKKINGAESRVVEREAGASGYVRCKATYDGVEVLSNEARVRVQPGAAPSNWKVEGQYRRHDGDALVGRRAKRRRLLRAVVPGGGHGRVDDGDGAQGVAV